MNNKELLYKSWNDITISLYQSIVDITSSELSDGEKEIAVISLLSGIPEQEIYDMDVKDVIEYTSQLHFLNDFKFNESWKSKKIVINNNQYQIEPDLTRFTYSQYVDFQSYWALKDNVKNLANLLSVFIIPKGKKYNTDYDIKEVIREIEEYLPITTANSILFFFLNYCLILIRNTKICLNWKLKMMTNKKNKQKMEKLKQAMNQYWTVVLDGFI